MVVADERPSWFELARTEIGTSEISGPKHNPRIVGYFRTIGMSSVTDDETAWCAAFVGSCLERSGYRSTKTAWARDYLKWGRPDYSCSVGCVVVLDRGGGYGHVGFLVKQDEAHVWLLGGNQNDGVNISSFPRSRVLGYRLPAEALAQDEVPETPKQLVRPPDRPAYPEPETFAETTDRLRDEGSRTIQSADAIKNIVKGTTIYTIFSNVIQNVTESDVVRIAAKFWWVPVLIALYFILKHVSEIAFARVHDARKGPQTQ